MKAGLLLGMLLLGGCGLEASLERAESALEKSQLPEAEKRFRRILEKHPDNVDALYGLGWTYHLAGEVSRAREFFTRCTRIAPEDYRGYKGLGSIALGEGHLVQAQERFEKALERAPGEVSVLNSLGLLHLIAKRYEEALALLEPLSEAEESRGEIGLNLAEAYLRLGRVEEAMTVVDSALAGRIVEKRFRALLLEMRARLYLRLTAGRVDDTRCEESLHPVLATLDLADAALEEALATGLDLPNLRFAQRQVHRRRSVAREKCSVIRATGN